MAVHYFLELMRERGVDSMAELGEAEVVIRAKLGEEAGREVSDSEFIEWLRERDPWALYLYLYGREPNPPGVLSPLKEPAYTGEQRGEFANKIRAAAARRRRHADAPWSCDCARLQAEKESARPLPSHMAVGLIA